MQNLISKLFLAAGIAGYALFALDRSTAFGVHDYSPDVVVIPLLGILAHLAFERRAA